MPNKTFEESLQELDSLVKKLENHDISLEEAVKCYTEGLELSKYCNEILSKNEELIVKKMTESGLVDFLKEN